MAEIIAAESLATGSLLTGSFHWFEAGKIWQWLSGGIATGFGVGLGVGLGVEAFVGTFVGALPGVPAGFEVGLGVEPGPLRPDGLLEGWLPPELTGGTEANVPGARPDAIARSDGGDSLGPSADGAHAAIRAATSSTPMAIDGRLRFTLRGYPGTTRRECIQSSRAGPAMDPRPRVLPDLRRVERTGGLEPAGHL
jgi:hypothetical protein